MTETRRNLLPMGLGALLLSVLLTSCTSKIAYDNLDWLAVRWVDRQINLDKDQRELVSQHVAAQQQWHCATQLQSYEAWLEQIRLDLLSNRIDRDQLVGYGDEMAEFIETLAERLAPMLVDLASSLDDQQVESALAELDERIEKLRDEIQTRSSEQWAVDRVEGMERRLKRLMGPLNPQQRQRLERWAQDIVPTHEYQLVQRLYWRERIEQALERRGDVDFLTLEVDALLDPAAVWPRGYQQAMKTNRTLTLDALTDLVKLIEPQQKNRVSARLSRLRNDFHRLSCEGKAPPTLLASTASGRPGSAR